MSSRFRRLPSYRYFDSADGVIENPAVSSLRDCTVTGNHGKNLIPYPFYETTETISGITFTDNGDGTITANGTATANVYYFIINSSDCFSTHKATYTMSGCPQGGGSDTYYMTFEARKDGKWVTDIIDYGMGESKDLSAYDFTVSRLVIVVKSGITLNNAVFKPQIELGETATEFEPYKGVGDKTKNLIPYPFYETTETISGITFTDNGDGTITANGTATANVYYFIINSTDCFSPHKATYTLSGCPQGGGSGTYFIRFELRKNGKWVKNWDLYGESINMDLTKYDYDSTVLVIIVASGITVNNLIFKPQLELGETATEFEPYGKYKIPILNDTRENLLNIGDVTVTQSQGYYGTYIISLTNSNISTFLPYLEEMKGEKVTYTSDLDNENFTPEIVFYFNESVDNGREYIIYNVNRDTAVFPNATPIRIEVRARSGNAGLDGTNVKISNISMKFTDFEPEVTNIYTDTQITDGESVSLKENGLADVKLHGKNILSVGTSVKPSAVNWQYYKY